MRLPAALTAALMAGVAGLAAQSAQTPIFRSSVDVLEVDVSVVDGESRPVVDLQGPDFTVTVDGQPRRVISSEFISDVSGESQLAGVTVDPYISNNTDRRPGRLIVIVVDQNNMTMDRFRGSLESTKKFISSLAPNDRIALMSIPSPGPRVDFTTNHQQVRDALNNVAANGDAARGRFNISNYEAIAFEDKTDTLAVQRMMFRLCGDNAPSVVASCGSDVEQDALQLAQRIRLQTTESVSALGALFKNLREVEGPKSLVLISQGLMLEGAASEAGALAKLASEARVNINVMLFDWEGSSASERMVSATQGADRMLRESGLDSLAARSRGALFRVSSNPDYVYTRITRELAGHYMLGVEPAPADRDGKQHSIKVQVKRKGTELRARQEFQYTTRAPNTWSRDDLMGRVLRSPSSATEIPMRVTSYVYQEAGSQNPKARVVAAVEIDPTTTGAVDVAIGHALYDDQGRPVDSGQERKIFSANSDRPLRYELAMSVNPGKYRLKIAAIDLAGNSGSVEREVQAWKTAGEPLAMGDLMLLTAREARGGGARPPVLLKVDDGQVVTFTELYTNAPGSLSETKVAFEVAENADAPALTSAEQTYRPSAEGTSAIASTVIPVASLPPGRYVVRAVVTSSGRPVGKMVRPFMLLPDSRPPVAATPSSGAASGATTTSMLAVPNAPDAGLIAGRASAFNRDDVLKPEMLRAAYDAMEKNHPLAKAALGKARSGQLQGTALMALDAGDQSAGALLRGIEFLQKGQLDSAATQFGVALRSAPDSALASFYLGACYAAAGKDRDALNNWERAKAAQLPLPDISLVIAGGYLRLGQPAKAVDSLAEALAKAPQNDTLRKDLGVAQSRIGQHEQAYATITPYLEKHPSDPDALMVALQAIYQAHAEGKSIQTVEQDQATAAKYARAYAAASGPSQALVEKWLQFLNAPGGAK